MDAWPHQLAAINGVLDAMDRQVKRLIVTTPTGGGKTYDMIEIARAVLEAKFRASIYTNRKILIEQTSEVMNTARLWHSVRAAGYLEDHDAPLQLSSVQTEHARCIRSTVWQLHKARLVIVDEGHLQTGPKAVEIFDRHVSMGAMVVYFTATPLNMGHYADELLVAGTNSELRQCGALVPAVHFAPDEPDLAAWANVIKKVGEGEDLPEGSVRTIMGKVVDGQPEKRAVQLFGRVWANYLLTNPDRRPTILFAPGVPESLWFAEQFTKNGAKWAHIDGEHIWIDGELQRTSTNLRDQVFASLKDGTLAGVSNRFVLREGVDAPFLSHGIFATIFGDLQTYLQSGGRLLRAAPGKPIATIQDHGGNYWRHGSLNADRDWFLDQTSQMAAGVRYKRFRDKKDKEPFCCPQCHRVWTRGTTCSKAHGGCGYELGIRKKSRPVVTSEGMLREAVGDIFRPRRTTTFVNLIDAWRQIYYRSRSYKKGRTFNAAMGLFAHENEGWFPDPTWPLMPRFDRDFYRLVRDVPEDRLR